MATIKHVRNSHRATPMTGRTRQGNTAFHAAWLLSVALAALMVAASAAGLLVDGLYREQESLAAMLRGYDLVTLVVAVPALLIALLGVRRGSVLGQLIWVGVLAYAIYNYAVYVFGTSFNDAFLVHAAAFSVSIFAFSLALVSLDVTAIRGAFHVRTPARLVSVLLATLAVGLGAMWIYYSVRFAVTGAAPTGSRLVETREIVHLGYVLDLAVLVPAYGLAAVLLWRRAGWGYVLAATVLVAGTIHQLAYLVAMPFQYNAGVSGASSVDFQEIPIVVIFAAAAALLLAGLYRRAETESDRTI